VTARRAETRGLVTVAVPTWNRAAFLRQCVNSVRRQTYDDLEILVGDNASTDDTPAVVGELAQGDDRIRYVRHAENLGMVGNWNALLRAATGRFFLLLSDDDLLAPDAIERLVSACDRPGVTFAYGPVFAIDAAGAVRDVYRRHGPPVEAGADFIRAHLHDERHVWPAATLYPIGGPSERQPYSGEIGAVCDFLHRLTLAARGRVGCVPEPVAYYRLHSGNETLQAVGFATSLFRLLGDPAVIRGELAPFAEDLRACVLRTVRGLVVGAAVHGRPAVARGVIDVIAAHGVHVGALRALALLLALPPVRLAAAWKRRVLAERVRAAAARAGRLPALEAHPA
jgi:Glycosyl transferase family 2